MKEEVAGIKSLWRGDTLTLSVVPGTDSEDFAGPRTFQIVVARATRSSRHGWYIHAMEGVGPAKEMLFYLDDGWDIRDSEGHRVVA